MLHISVGVMAYNEEHTIVPLLRAVCAQRLRKGTVREILVVASGCTDRTTERVLLEARRDSRIELLVQPRRTGKASAVNLFLRRAQGPVNVLIGADLLPAEEAFEHLIQPFRDAGVGMTGARPIPRNPLGGTVPHAVHLLWRLHHRLALEHPKLGELVAFRAVVPSIPGDTWVDEVALEHHFVRQGYRLVYVPEAVVWNRGPDTVREFVRQRRRIHSGHLDYARKTGYRVGTWGIARVLGALKQEWGSFPPTSRPYLLGAVFLEGWARILGRMDAMRRTSVHVVWEPSPSTKRPLGGSR